MKQFTERIWRSHLKMTHSIRNAIKNDLYDINKIDDAVFPGDSYNLVALNQFIDLFPRLSRVLISNGRIAGFCIGGIDQDENGWMLALAVQPDLQGHGFGTSLAKDFCNLIDDHGCKKSYLTVDPKNYAAISIYRRLGFEEIFVIPDYFGPGEDRAKMIRSLF